jgi:hypothetical protein
MMHGGPSLDYVAPDCVFAVLNGDTRNVRFCEARNRDDGTDLGGIAAGVRVDGGLTVAAKKMRRMLTTFRFGARASVCRPNLSQT